jgi:PilZ domain
MGTHRLNPTPSPGAVPGTVRRERRAHVRLPRPYRITYFAASGDEAGQARGARVVDLSPGGIGVMADRHFQVGATITLCFSGAAEATSLLAPVRVVRVEALPGGGWFLGCRFATELGVGAFGEVLERMSGVSAAG